MQGELTTRRQRQPPLAAHARMRRSGARRTSETSVPPSPRPSSSLKRQVTLWESPAPARPVPVLPNTRFKAALARLPAGVADENAVEHHANGTHFPVEKLLARYYMRLGWWFLVRWKGYNSSWDLWRPRKPLMQDCPKLVLAFERACQHTPPPSTPLTHTQTSRRRSSS